MTKREHLLADVCWQQYAFFGSCRRQVSGILFGMKSNRLRHHDVCIVFVLFSTLTLLTIKSIYARPMTFTLVHQFSGYAVFCVSRTDIPHAVLPVASFTYASSRHETGKRFDCCLTLSWD